MGKHELIIVSGERRGEVFEFNKKLVTVGRDPGNDIVLPDKAVSSRHCEITIAGGSFYIADAESSNGTWLNGREIKKTQLLPGDKIRVGDTTLSFSFSEGKTLCSAFRMGNLRSRKLAALVLLIVLVLGAVSVFFRGLQTTSGAAPAEPFELCMIEKKGDFFQSQITISGDGGILFSFDDIKKRRHFRKEAVLTSKELEQVRGTILNSGFLKISEESTGDFEESMLSFKVKLGALEKELSFGKDLPEAVQVLTDELSALADRKFDIPPAGLSADELIGKSRDLFALGKKFFSEKQLKCSNLYNSICAFREALMLLETVEPKPDFYGNVEEYLYRTETELGNKFNDLRFRAEKAIKFKEWEKAGNSLEKILTEIPDRADKRYIYALKRLENVKKKLLH